MWPLLAMTSHQGPVLPLTLRLQDDKMGVATAVLCVLRIPPLGIGRPGQSTAAGSTLPSSAYEYALRSAVQVRMQASKQVKAVSKVKDKRY